MAPTSRSHQAGPRTVWLVLAAVIATALLITYSVDFRYAYLPSDDKLVSAPRLPAPAYDLWGDSISPAEAERIRATA